MLARLTRFKVFKPILKKHLKRLCYASAFCSTLYVSYKYSNTSFKYQIPSLKQPLFPTRFEALCARRSSKDSVDAYLDDIVEDEIDDHFHLQSAIRETKKMVSANKMLDIFKSMYMSGESITQAFLVEMFYTAGIEDKRVAEHLFQMMDSNRDGILQPSEIMAVLTMFQIGRPIQRFKFLFRCLDLDGGGTVDKSEFRATLTAVLEAKYHLGGLNDLFDHDEIFADVFPHEYHTVAKFKANRIVRDIFLIADTNRDGELSLKEFLHWCRTGSKEVRLLENALINAVDRIVYT
eukprot:387183_1